MKKFSLGLIFICFFGVSSRANDHEKVNVDQPKSPKAQEKRSDDIVNTLKSCEALAHTSDAGNRQLYKKITNACNPNESNGAMGEGSKKTIQNIIVDTRNYHIEQTLKDMAEDIRKAELAQSIYATWASYVRFNNSPPLNAASALKMICPEHAYRGGHVYISPLCNSEEAKNKIKNDFSEFQKNAHVEAYSKAEENSDISQFNAIVDKYNKTLNECKATQKALHPNTLYNDYQAKKDQDAIKNFKLDLSNNPQKSYLDVANQLYDSNLGKYFMVIDDFREKVGKVSLDCRNAKPLQKVSGNDLAIAKMKYVSMAKESLDEYNHHLYDGAEEYVKNFIKEHPKMVGDILKEKNSKAYATATCKMINEINSSDANWKYVDYALIGAGFIAATAMTLGTATPVLAFMMAGSSTAMVSATAAIAINAGGIAEIAIAGGMLARGHAKTTRLEDEKKALIVDYANGKEKNGTEAIAITKEAKNLENETKEVVQEALTKAALTVTPEGILQVGKFLSKYKNLAALAKMGKSVESIADETSAVKLGSKIFHEGEGIHKVAHTVHEAHEITEKAISSYSAMKEGMEAHNIIIEGIGEKNAGSIGEKVFVKTSPDRALIEGTYYASLKTNAEKEAYIEKFKKASDDEAYAEAKRKFDENAAELAK